MTSLRGLRSPQPLSRVGSLLRVPYSLMASSSLTYPA